VKQPQERPLLVGIRDIVTLPFPAWRLFTQPLKVSHGQHVLLTSPIRHPILNTQPALRNRIAYVLEPGVVAKLVTDEFTQSGDALSCELGGITGGADEANDPGVVFLQFRFVEVGVLLVVVALVGHDDDRRITAAATDHFQPIVDRAVIFAAGFQHQEIQAALSQKESVRAVHDLLTPEVPDVQHHLATVG